MDIGINIQKALRQHNHLGKVPSPPSFLMLPLLSRSQLVSEDASVPTHGFWKDVQVSVRYQPFCASPTCLSLIPGANFFLQHDRAWSLSDSCYLHKTFANLHAIHFPLSSLCNVFLNPRGEGVMAAIRQLGLPHVLETSLAVSRYEGEDAGFMGRNQIFKEVVQKIVFSSQVWRTLLIPALRRQRKADP